MGAITKAEQYLLDQIRQGDDQAWSQLVDRYNGRLLAFARKQLPQSADADDVVQDTFVNFIRGLGAFRGQCGLESYLFTILRRRIIEIYRKAGSKKISLIQDLYASGLDPDQTDSWSQLPANDPTASWYVRRDERKEKLLAAFSASILPLLEEMKKSLNFEHLKIIELLFFCGLSNTDAAAVMKYDPSRIGVVKHRCMKQVKNTLCSPDLKDLSDGDFEGIIRQVWQQFRPSCPKRSTIGAFLLNTLDEGWQNYADFHLNTLGCHFCRANLEDLKAQNQQKGAEKIRQRIMESTVGFLKK